MTGRVVHCKKEPFDTYIGRAFGGMPASKWGNPFKTPADGTREEVIVMFEMWLRQQPELIASLHELKGKTLSTCL